MTLWLREYASIVIPRGTRGAYLMIRAYFDDSGTHQNGSPVVVVGGLLGSDVEWADFEAAWGNRLKEPLPGKPPLPYFGLADCRSGDKPFGGYNQAERDELTFKFRQIIADSKLKALSAAIDRVAWDELVTGPLKTNMPDPERFCLVASVNNAMAYARSFGPDERVAVFYDKGRMTGSLEKIAALYERYPIVASFNFLPVAEFLPLQGADMVATESYWHAQKYLRDGDNAVARAHFQDFLGKIDGAGFILDRADIAKELQRRNADGSLKSEDPYFGPLSEPRA